jgi:lysophospholipase L1-like esterase
MVSSTGATYATARTDSSGSFTLTTTGLTGATSIGVRLTADNPAGAVSTPTGAAYYVTSTFASLSPGGTRTGVALTLATGSETTNAFALLDAVRTAGAYYQRIRDTAWDARLGVRYPSGSDVTSMNKTTHLITVSGGQTQCGTRPCFEDAYDWDVLAHEVGHVVAYQGGFADSQGGQHFVCAGIWTTGSKSDAVRLAWSEGWATFYGLASLQEQGVPGIPEAGGQAYDDHRGPLHPDGDDDFAYSLESQDGCDYQQQGDDNEIAVSRVLWDLYDSAADNGESVSWSLTDILGRLRSARPTTFIAAYAVLTGSRSVADTDSAHATLEASAMSPTGVLPAGSVTGTCPPRITWRPGGPSAHPNTTFVVRAVNPTTRQTVFSRSTTQLYLDPTQAEWQAATATGSVLFQVSGLEATAPVGGPYWSGLRTPAVTAAPRLMVVGDSISHGLEDDYTWRYRLAQHLSTGCAADFVGPRTGTTVLPAAQPDGYPEVSAPASFTGRYRGGLTFDSAHFAQWGWQLGQAEGAIRAEVSAQQPTHLLVELGFNDLGWGTSSPDDLITHVRTFVAEARAARPAVRILFGNVVNRTALADYPGLPATIASYNAKLGPALAALSTATSPVALVDLNTPYVPTADTYDGLHPNGRGEYKLAKAFADVLSSKFGIGSAFGSIPTTVPDVVPPRPASLTATATDAGITVRWSHSVGAGGYWLYQRDATNGEAFARSALAIPADSWKIGWVVRGHTYEFKVVAARGDTVVSAESPVGSVVANPKTADGPVNVNAYPGATSIALSWTRPTTTFSDTISGYRVYFVDETTGGWADTRSTSGTSYTLTGLVAGHRYNVAIASVNAAGEGLPSGVPASIVGSGAPGTTTVTSAALIDGWTVDVAWRAVPGAAAYWIDHRNVPAGEPLRRLPLSVNGTTNRVTWLVDGAENYEFCIVPANGSYLGPRSACRRAAIEAPNGLVDAATSDSRRSPPAVLPADPGLLQQARWSELARSRVEGAADAATPPR